MALAFLRQGKTVFRIQKKGLSKRTVTLKSSSKTTTIFFCVCGLLNQFYSMAKVLGLFPGYLSSRLLVLYLLPIW